MDIENATYAQLLYLRRSYRQDLAALLHIGNRQCALILRHMVEDGRLVRVGQQYYLPEQEEVL